MDASGRNWVNSVISNTVGGLAGLACTYATEDAKGRCAAVGGSVSFAMDYVLTFYEHIGDGGTPYYEPDRNARYRGYQGYGKSWYGG